MCIFTLRKKMVILTKGNARANSSQSAAPSRGRVFTTKEYRAEVKTVCLAAGEVTSGRHKCQAAQYFLCSLVAEVSPTLGRPGQGTFVSPENSLWSLIQLQLSYAPVVKACLNILEYLKK